MDVLQNFREIGSSEVYRKSLGIAKKNDMVKTELWFNFFQVQTAVYRYIGKPFHHLNIMIAITWEAFLFILWA